MLGSLETQLWSSLFQFYTICRPDAGWTNSWMRPEWIMGSGDHGFVHSSSWQREVFYVLERKQRTALPTKPWSLMEGTVGMEAHNKQTCDNTQASVWVFRWGPSSEVLLSHCYCLVPTAAVGVDELAVDVLCPDWTKDICTYVLPVPKTQTFIRQLSLLRVEEQHTEFINI